MNGCCTPNPCTPCAPVACPPINVPGPNGQNAFAPLIANLTIPANTATPVSASFTNTAWLLPGQTIFVSDATDGKGTFTVSSITSPTTATLLWSNAPGDSVSGTVLTVANGASASPGGAPGTAINGINAFTILTANYTIPPDFVTQTTATVANSQWATVGQAIVIGNAIDGVATVRVVSIPDATHIVTLAIQAPKDATLGGSIFAANNSTVSPAGFPGSPGERYLAFNTGTTFQNVGTGVTTLMFNQVPAGQLSVNSDMLDFEAVFALTNNGNTKTVTVTFGATTLITVTGAQALANSVLIITGRIIRMTATTQMAYVTALISPDAGPTIKVVTALTQPGETLANSILLACTGQSSAATGDVIQRVLRARYTPN